MNEVLTMDQIEERYNGEWVLLGDPEIDDHHAVVRGRLIGHSPDRDEIDRIDHELRLRSAAILFIGGPPDDLVFVL
jgi:hypothetical protein